MSSTEGCALDKMPLASKENGMDKNEENQSEPVASQTTMEKVLENVELDSEEREGLRNFAVSLLKGYNIEEDVKKAVDSGNIEDYCRDLAKKLEETTNAKGVTVAEGCLKFNEQALVFFKEEIERKRNELGQHDDGESFKAKFNSLPDPVKRLVKRAWSLGDYKFKVYDCVKRVLNEDSLVFQAKCSEEAQRIADKVLVATKAMCLQLQESGSNTSCSTTDEVVTSFEKDGGDDLMDSKSDEDSEKPPITDQDDEHVIPTPPPPPPVKSLCRDKVDEINESILEHRKYQLNQIKKELNFAIARLTSEVIKSYEQTTALQTHVAPSLEKSPVDFMQSQETKKTYFIKEIATRIHKVLRLLTPEPEIDDPNLQLEDLSETIRLLYLLQATRKYPLDKASVTTTSTNEKIKVEFYILLLLTVIGTVMALSLNGEWLALIMFMALVFVFMIKSWQGILSVRKKSVEVFRRVKKSEKID